MKIRNNLSQIGCSRTFKNILRNENDDNNVMLNNIRSIEI